MQKIIVGVFPVGSFGLRFTEEEFMKPMTSVLSNGKLRVSFGQTGNSNIGNRAISYYQTGNNNEFGGTESIGVYLSQMGNPDLKWKLLQNGMLVLIWDSSITA